MQELSDSARRAKRVSAMRFVQALAIIAVGIAGCATPSLSDIVVGSDFVPQNVHRSNSHLPSDVRRVAVLPMTSAQTSSDIGVELLFPVLLDELTKTKKFEVIPVTSEQLGQWTGKIAWKAEENLPQN